LESLGITPVAQVVDNISSLPPSDVSSTSTPDTSLKPDAALSPRLKSERSSQLLLRRRRKRKGKKRRERRKS